MDNWMGTVAHPNVPLFSNPPISAYGAPSTVVTYQMQKVTLKSTQHDKADHPGSAAAVRYASEPVRWWRGVSDILQVPAVVAESGDCEHSSSAPLIPMNAYYHCSTLKTTSSTDTGSPNLCPHTLPRTFPRKQNC